MTGVAARGSESDRFERKFWRVLIIGATCLLLLGGFGFGFLKSLSPLTLLKSGDRPIAAATTLIPANSPFTISLLTRPDRLIALQQAMVRPELQASARQEAQQVQQNLSQLTGLDYARDIQPWMGSEVTFAYTDLDLDRDDSNGQQPGYLLVFEIAPDAQLQAQSFLQLFWQQQAFLGNPGQATNISGVRVLSSQRSGQPSNITNVSALVGEQFVVFANDIRALRHGLQSAQTAQNLAQNIAYRERVAALPARRIGLAYLDTQLLSRGEKPGALSSNFIALSIGLTKDGITLDAGNLTGTSTVGDSSSLPNEQTLDVLMYAPVTTELAVTGRDLSQFVGSWEKAGLSRELLPPFLGGVDSATQLSSIFSGWMQSQYALAKISGGRASDWILSVAREATRLDELNQAATKAGYSVVPVSIGETEAVAWTRFKASTRRRSSASGLETELLGLHLQQGDIEIFTSSLAAMETALAAPRRSLLDAPQFVQAMAPFEAADDAVVYADWVAIAPAAVNAVPAIGTIQSVAAPLMRHVGSVAAALEGESVHVFIQFADLD
ncbi:MAG: DUF3352 domain-containing protein [Cyanobacteria bacterium J06598_1]